MKAKNQKNQNVSNIEAIEKETILNSLNTVSDAELMQGLDNLNLNLLTSKIDVNRSIWNNEAKQIKSTETQSRNYLRKLQLSLSKKLLTSLVNKDNVENQKICAKNLFEFYSKNLVNFANYSNISIEKEKDKRQIIDLAYQKMKLFEA